MMKSLPLCLILVGSSVLAADPAQPAAAAINALGLDLLARTGTPGESTLLSPYSIQVALAMTYAGARGETREQMAAVLHYPPDDVHQAFAALQKQLTEAVQRTEEADEPIALATANRLFGQTGYAFRPAYLKFLQDTYAAPMEELNFRKDPVRATRTINAWVEKQTRDRIRNLIPEPLDRDTGLVLVNAIYLKAPWATAFPEKATAPAPFHPAEGKSFKVPTMVLQADFGYAAKDGFEVLTLPYVGHDLQFLIILPATADGLPALEKKLTAKALVDYARLESRKVTLHLPRFKLEPPVFQLSDVLKDLGMKNAFNVPRGSADFDGIAPRRPDDYLYISGVFHKTFVAIDEKGTEAAAATAVVMARVMLAPTEPEKPLEVRVDRPFLFAIQHRPSGACLFLGRMTRPGL